MPTTPMSTPTDGRRIAIVAGVRTPFCRAGGPLDSLGAAELGRIVLAEIAERTRVPLDAVDHVLMGNCGTPADSANVARVSALLAGFPRKTPAASVHRNCASGFEALTQAAEKIRAGEAKVAVAGGTESMSNYPISYPKAFGKFLERLSRQKSLPGKLQAALAWRPSLMTPQISLMQGLTDPTCGLIMGKTAEVLAREFSVSREAQDAYALESHRRAVAAARAGRFKAEIVPVFAGKEFTPVTADAGPREEQTLEALAKLKPYFDRRFGTVTVGNSCQITDGAVALLVMREDAAKAEGFAPLGFLRSHAYAGLDPARMGLGPVFATGPALDKAGLSMKDIGRVEINEAFAVQVIANEIAFDSDAFARKELGRPGKLGPLPREITNVNGGAIALGHPVGATGARLVLTLLHEMARADVQFGLATLCVGGGQGASLILERS